MRALLEPNHYSVLDKHPCLMAIDYDSFVAFVDSFYNEMFVEGLVMGNITREVRRCLIRKALRNVTQCNVNIY